MAIQLTKIGNSPNTPTKDYVCDLRTEIKKLPKVVMGSTCFCLEDKSAWVKGSDEWKEITSLTSSNKELEILEQLIDQSGVLDDEEETLNDKVEALIDKADIEKWLWDNSVFGDDTRIMTLGKVSTLTYIPKTRLFSKCASLQNAFSNSKALTTIFGLGMSGVTTAANAFQGCVALETVVLENTENVVSWYHAFYMCSNLKSLRTFNLSSSISTSNTSDMFYSCTSLEEVRFVPETIKVSIAIPSPVLSIGNVFDLTDTENVGSVQSIINGLATLAEGAAAQTLTLSKNLPLTAEQKQAITTAVNNKGWTLAFA